MNNDISVKTKNILFPYGIGIVIFAIIDRVFMRNNGEIFKEYIVVDVLMAIGIICATIMYTFYRGNSFQIYGNELVVKNIGLLKSEKRVIIKSIKKFDVGITVIDENGNGHDIYKKIFKEKDWEQLLEMFAPFCLTSR